MDSHDPIGGMWRLPEMQNNAMEEPFGEQVPEMNQQHEMSNMNHRQTSLPDCKYSDSVLMKPTDLLADTSVPSDTVDAFDPALLLPVVNEASVNNNLMNTFSTNPNDTMYMNDVGYLPVFEPVGHDFQYGQNITSSTSQAMTIDGSENTFNVNSHYPDTHHHRGNASQQDDSVSSQNQKGAKSTNRERKPRGPLQQVNPNTMRPEHNTAGPQRPAQSRNTHDVAVAEDMQASSSSGIPPPPPSPPPPPKAIDDMTRKEMKDEIKATVGSTSVRRKTLKTKCRPVAEIWKKLGTKLPIADYDSLALTDRDLVLSWMKAPLKYTKRQVTHVLQYFDQISQELGRQVVVEILRMRSAYDQQGGSQAQLSRHPLDPLVIFPGDASGDSVRGVPPVGFVLAHIGVFTNDVRPDRCLVEGAQRIYSRGEKYLQLETHPSSWEPIPIGTTCSELLANYPNHCHHEFLDVFIQCSLGARSMYEAMTATPQSKVMFEDLKKAEVWTGDQDTNGFQKRADRRLAIVVKKYGFEAAKVYFDSESDISTRELGSVDSQKSTKMGNLDHWKSQQLKNFNFLENDSDQAQWPDKCDGSGSVMHPRYDQLNGDSHITHQGVHAYNPQHVHHHQQHVGSSHVPASNGNSVPGESSVIDPQLVNPASSTNDLDLGQRESIHTPAQLSHTQQEAASIPLNISCSVQNGQLGSVAGMPFWTSKEEYTTFMKVTLDLLRQQHQLAGIVDKTSRDSDATKSGVLFSLMDGYVASSQVAILSENIPEASSVIRLLEAAVLKQYNENRIGHDDLDQTMAQRLKQQALVLLAHEHKTFNLAFARIINSMVMGKTIDYQDRMLVRDFLYDTSVFVETTTNAVEQQLMLLEDALPLDRMRFEDDYSNVISHDVVTDIMKECGILAQDFGSLEHFQKCLENAKARRSSLMKDIDDNVPDSDGSLYSFAEGRLDHVVERLQSVVKQLTPSATRPSHEDSRPRHGTDGDSDGRACTDKDSNNHGSSHNINKGKSAVRGQKAANPTSMSQSAPARGTKRSHQDTDGDEGQDLTRSRGTHRVQKKTKAQGDDFQPIQPRSAPVKPQERPPVGQVDRPAPKRRQSALKAVHQSNPSLNIEPLAGKKRSAEVDDVDDSADDRPPRRHRSNSFVPDESVLRGGDVNAQTISPQDSPQEALDPSQESSSQPAGQDLIGDKLVGTLKGKLRARLTDHNFEEYSLVVQEMFSGRINDAEFNDRCDFLYTDGEARQLHHQLIVLLFQYWKRHGHIHLRFIQDVLESTPASVQTAPSAAGGTLDQLQHELGSTLGGNFDHYDQGVLAFDFGEFDNL